MPRVGEDTFIKEIKYYSTFIPKQEIVWMSLLSPSWHVQ